MDKIAKELVRLAKDLTAAEWHEDEDADEGRDKALREFSRHVGGEKILTAEKIKGSWFVFLTELGAYRLAHQYRADWRNIGKAQNHPGWWYVKI